MAFNQDYLFLGRGVYNACEFGLAPSISTYDSSTDTFSVITTSGYFPPLFNSSSDGSNIQVGDLLMIEGSDTQGIMIVTSINPVLLSNFSTAASSQTITNTNYTSTGALTVSVPFQIVTDGSLINLQYTSMTGTASASGNVTFNLPVATAPAENFFTPVMFVVGGTAEIGIMIVESSGTIIFNRLNGSNFSGAITIESTPVTYRG